MMLQLACLLGALVCGGQGKDVTALELGDFVDKLGAFCHRDLRQGERGGGERRGRKKRRGEDRRGRERGLDCLTGRYFVVLARLAGARSLPY